MHKGRLEAFSDGVIAIIITIMVLDLKAPHEASFEAVGDHLLQASRHVDGRVLWANMHLLFWLSLIPFVTDFMGENHFATVPVALYGAVLFVCGLAYWILSKALIASHPSDSPLTRAVSNGRKEMLSLSAYAAAVALAWVSVWVSCALYVLVALLWLVPDRRIEKTLEGAQS